MAEIQSDADTTNDEMFALEIMRDLSGRIDQALEDLERVIPGKIAATASRLTPAEGQDPRRVFLMDHWFAGPWVRVREESVAYEPTIVRTSCSTQGSRLMTRDRLHSASPLPRPSPPLPVLPYSHEEAVSPDQEAVIQGDWDPADP
ncbi:MAG: hypothetical protein AMXMBFR16_00820 [Candidatus Uhrbacteria bacterium]